MITLWQALKKLAEIEQRDGVDGFIQHIYFFTGVNEYYLQNEFGMEYAGTGCQMAHYIDPWDGREVDIQYTQVAYAIAKRVGLGPVGRVVAAGHMVGWTDIIAAKQMLSGNGLKGLEDYAWTGANYRGWELGMDASRHDTFGQWVRAYVPAGDK